MANVSEIGAYLKAIGYDPTSEDEVLIDLCLSATNENIMNQCNLTEIPESLDNVVILRSAGAFLQIRNASGTLLDTLNIADVEKKITEGDTTVELAISDSDTPQKLISNYINWLKEYGKRDIAAYRRLHW